MSATTTKTASGREALHPSRTLSDCYPVISDERATGAGHHLITRQYPTGDVEITSLRLSPDDSLNKGGGAVRKNTKKEDMTETVLSKSCQRAKIQIRRKCLSMQADRLLTITFRKNETDIDLAWKKFKYFCTLMRWRYGENFKYVAVPEYQKRGAVHFHLAVRGYYHYNTVRRLWIRAAGDSGGNVDFTGIKKRHGKQEKNPRKIANYIGKYISKADDVAFNKRRYSSGGKIEVPEPIYGWLCITDAVVYHLCKLLTKMTHKPVSNIWEAEGRYPIICIST